MTTFPTPWIAVGVLVLYWILSGVLHAEEIRYVTDTLQLGLFEQDGGGGRRLRSLPSGTAVTVLNRHTNFSRVLTPDGTEGWVKNAYLVSEVPAKARLAALEKENAMLGGKLDAAHRVQAETRQAVEEATRELRSELADARAELQLSRGRVSTLVDEREQLESRYGVYRRLEETAHPYVLAAAVLLGMFLAGLAAGWYLVHLRLKRRFSGFDLG